VGGREGGRGGTPKAVAVAAWRAWRMGRRRASEKLESAAVRNRHRAERGKEIKVLEIR